MFQSKSFLVGLCLILGALFSACSSDGSASKKSIAEFDDLFYVSKEKDGKITKGFMDKTGKLVLGPWDSFEWNGKKYGADEKSEFKIMPFIGGMAGICFNEDKDDAEKAKCGFMDKTGKIVIEPKYKKVSYFSEGLAAVSEDGSKFGYLDKTGKQIIEAKFKSNSPFSEGLAPAGEEIMKVGFIDKTGKYVIEPKFLSAKSFAEGHAVVQPAAEQQIIIDKTGKQVAALKTPKIVNTDFYYKETFFRPFYQADGEYEVDIAATFPTFNEGLTMSTRDKNTLESDEVGFMKTDGNLEIKLDRNSFDQIRPFSDGFAPAKWKSEENWTFVDRTGKTKIDGKKPLAMLNLFRKSSRRCKKKLLMDVGDLSTKKSLPSRNFVLKKHRIFTADWLLSKYTLR